MNLELSLQLFLDLKELIITDVKISEKRIDIQCCSVFEETLCPNCLKKCKIINQKYIRTIQDLSISGKKVFLYLQERQFYCEDCNRHFMERFSFVEPNRHQTDRLERQVYDICIQSNINHVLTIIDDISWTTANEIFNRQAKKQINIHSKDKVKWIGIDEFAIKKGHKDFGVVIVDLERVVVIDVLNYRDQDKLIEYFKNKGTTFCNRITYFCSDMWDGFVNTAKACFPNVTIVTDRFHFFYHLNKSVDHQRKALRKEFKDSEDLKYIKWLLLKNKTDLTKVENETLEKAFKVAPELKTVYYKKEDFRAILEEKITREEAENKINKWVEDSEKINNKYLNIFLKTLNNWKPTILNYFTNRITSSIVEGINNKVKLIKRLGFGFTNFTNFKNRIIASFG